MTKAECICLFQFIRCHAKLPGPCMGCPAYGLPYPVIDTVYIIITKYNNCLHFTITQFHLFDLFVVLRFLYFFFKVDKEVSWAIEDGL